MINFDIFQTGVSVVPMLEDSLLESLKSDPFNCCIHGGISLHTWSIRKSKGGPWYFFINSHASYSCENINAFKLKVRGGGGGGRAA